MDGVTYATMACSSKYDNIRYDELDCQAFVEKVAQDCGIRRPNGTVYNWKGSNDMWRNAMLWKGTVEECILRFGEIPLGSWVFIVKNDGGEKARGYNDGEGNASHVGIFVSQTDKEHAVRDSTKTKTRDGVGYRKLDGFNMVGLPYIITYFPDDNISNVTNKISKDDALKALETLTKFIKEC